MTLHDAQLKLADAYQLLTFSEELLNDVEKVPLSELPRLIQLLHKNIRDAKDLVNDAEAKIDDVVREIDRKEELEVMRQDYKDLVMYDEWAGENARLLKEQGFKEVGE